MEAPKEEVVEAAAEPELIRKKKEEEVPEGEEGAGEAKAKPETKAEGAKPAAGGKEEKK